MGSVTGANVYDNGTNATITATPASGYKFYRWKSDNAEVSRNASYTFPVKKNIEFVAEFVIDFGTTGKTGTCEWVLTGERGSNDYTLTVGGDCEMTDYDDNNRAPWYSEKEHIKNLIIGEDVKTIGDNAFDGCNGLTEVNIPDGVTTIGERAFKDCSELTSLTIGKGVTAIEDEAFAGCVKLKNVYVEAEDIPTLGNNAFDGIPTDAALHVPCGMKESYEDSSWRRYFADANIGQNGPHVLTGESNDDNMGTVDIVPNTCTDDNATLTAKSKAGYRFSKWADDNSTNPVRTVTVMADMTVKAIFIAIEYNISVKVTEEIKCFGENGTLKVTVTGAGATAPYQCKLDDGDYQEPDGNSFTFTVSAGTYLVTVKDKNNSERTKEVNVTGPGEITVVPEITHVSCYGSNNGEIILSNISGGTPPYTSYSFDDGNTYSGRNSKTEVVGNYKIRVKDIKGCESPTVDVTVEEPEELKMVLCATPSSCNGKGDGSITVSSISGGTPDYQFRIKDDPNYSTYQDGYMFGNLSAGEYTVIARDARGCESTAVTISVLEQTTLSAILSITPISCSDKSNGRITVLGVKGGIPEYRYSIYGDDESKYVKGQTIFDNLPADDYEFIVKDDNGCKSLTVPVSLTAPEALIFDPKVTQDVSCNDGDDGSITVSGVSGGTEPYLYSINGGSSYQNVDAFDNLIAGDYQIIVKDDNGCKSPVVPLTVSQPTALTVTPEVTNHVSCNGGHDGEITITASGGTGTLNTYHYSIYGDDESQYKLGKTVFRDLTATEYMVIARDEHGCRSSVVPVTITEPAALIASDIRVATCPGRSNVSLSKYVDTVDIRTLSWDGHLSIGTSTGIIPSIPATAPTTYTFKYSVSNECATSDARVYLYAVKDKMPFTQPDTVAVCRDRAEAIQINQIIGIDAEDGEWRTVPELLPDTYTHLSPADSPYAGAFVFDGKKYSDDVLPTITYHGVPAHQIEFYYSTPSGNCTGKKEYKTVIVLTPDIMK
jgi:hypothetical protein